MRSYLNNDIVLCHREDGPDKNYVFLRENGLTISDVKNVLVDLEVRDYIFGPCESDTDLPGRNDVWKFGKTVVFSDAEYELYIKIAVGQRDDALICLCISFHPCEYPLTYQFR